ncbi:antibiotic biosynthesis monooxygenase [Actinoplanes sp. SE50]|uniref:antibiotic biosynthesis monooxygenase family protein n=1 Tax=unclassified Actinoplanes TaxID=2626549 RepID=UPI00023EBCC7|nr:MULTISPECIES: antibiotic biosynthesis monooxygenase family protein [unclassified Actinoplanes]AEV82336.1 antibiotic biosynthesis monooxygenase [Actinoplanes sp. SE50/110]ATO80733.1 antibiotic biosynthesis monooxygenase [Actinoplanes sp. SE50]SLL98141.1 antibiotic biosynthesis monooxygenase [Actinoplanes sp. SE50/110]
MLVLNRFLVPPDTQDDFREQAHAALAALAGCPGYLSGRLARALEDTAAWTLVTEWESVGAYRRALGNFDVKVHATPLLARSLDEPSAFETLAAAGPGEPVTETASDRAAESWR